MSLYAIDSVLGLFISGLIILALLMVLWLLTVAIREQARQRRWRKEREAFVEQVRARAEDEVFRRMATRR